MLDMRANSPRLVSGSRHRTGVMFKQNGDWDDRILCETHEKIIGCADDYGIGFCRKWQEARSVIYDGRAFEVPNSRPDMLLHFAYAVVWRHAMALDVYSSLSLAHYERQILDSLLTRGPYGLQLLIGASPLVLKGEPVNIGLPPYHERLLGLNVVHFVVSGLSFYLKTDQRTFPASWTPFLANNNERVVLGRLDPLDMRYVPKFRTIFDQMRRRS